MAKQKKHSRKEPTKVPYLSAAEWTAILVWLDFRIACSKAELERWREAARINRNPQTLGSVAYHRNALTALERAQKETRHHYDTLVQSDNFAPATAAPIDVVARN